MDIDTFLARWRNAGSSERADYQHFIADLCALLAVDPPQPASEDTRDNPYVLERRVVLHHGDGSTSNRFIDCYRRAALIEMLDDVVELRDLRSPPGNRLEALSGNRSGQHSIRINDQWRVCFVWTDGGPTNVEIVDYH